MIPIIAGWLVKAGLSQAKASKLALPALIAGLLALAGIGFGIWLHFHDRGVVSHAQDRAEAKAAPIIRKADETATESRARGDAAINQRTQEMHNALDPLSDEKLSSRDRARYCAILRRQAAERGSKAPAGC